MGLVSGRSQYNYDHNIPCRNPQCKSYGRPHPNCQCTSAGPQTGRSGGSGPSGPSKSITDRYAQGGEVHFCESHLGHAPECEYYADGGQVEANLEFEAHPTLALDHSIVSHGLLHALTRTGHSQSENPNKPSEDFLDHSRRGRKGLRAHVDLHFNPKHEHPQVKKEGISSLKNHLESINQNPAQLLELGSLPGNPDHSAALGAKAALVSNYFESLKPKQSLPGPLDDMTPTDKMAEKNYNRQLGLAEHPLSILTKVRDGTVLPTDIQTLQTLYPDLTQSIQNKAFESLVNAKSSGTKISYKHKMGLSMLLGQPLDSTMTQASMQAIMHANAGAQTESQGLPNKAPRSGATEATQRTIAKVDDLYKTSLEKIQTGK